VAALNDVLAPAAAAQVRTGLGLLPFVWLSNVQCGTTDGTNHGTTWLADEWHKQQKIMILNMRFICHPFDIATCQFAALAAHCSLAMLAVQ
jgi:hypothetical protein